MAKAPPDDAPILTSVSWEDRSWWSGQLNRQSALDYFSHSQFYDRTCLNQVLKMQVALTPQAVLEKLARLPGTVYELDESKTQEVPPTDGEPAHTLYAAHSKVCAAHTHICKKTLKKAKAQRGGY